MGDPARSTRAFPSTSPESNFRTTLLPGMEGRALHRSVASCYNISAPHQASGESIQFVRVPVGQAYSPNAGFIAWCRCASVLKSGNLRRPALENSPEAAAGETYPAKPGVSNLSLSSVIPNTIQSVLLSKAKGSRCAQLAEQQKWK